MLLRISKATVLSAGVVLSLGSAFVNAAEQFADFYWACGSGSWSSTCWSNTQGGPPTLGPPTAPGPPDPRLFLHNSGATNIGVAFNHVQTSHLIRLAINATGTGSMTLSMTGGALVTEFTHVGEIGTGTFNQFDGRHSTLGSVFVGPQGTYNFSGGNIISESITVDGTFNQSGGQAGGDLRVRSTGTYNLSGGSLFSGFPGTIDGTFNQTGGERSGNHLIINGTYNFSNGSATDGFLSLRGTFNQTGGSYAVSGPLQIDNTGTYNLADGKLSAAEISKGGTFNFTGGTLSVSQFNGDLINAGGILAPGTPIPKFDTPPLSTNISGNYTQSRSGTYAVDIGGLLKGTEYDVLNVSGTAYLDGLLKVSFLDLSSGLFSPHLGDFFDILSAEQVIGGFRFLSLPELGRSLSWNIAYLPDAVGTTDVVRLSVAPIPEPEIYAMMMVGLGMLGWVGRRKKLRAAAAA